MRATEALLQAHGRCVMLRVPAPAVSGSEAEALGLATPLFNDIALAPCVFRKAGDQRELLVSALAVSSVVGSLPFDSAAVLFSTAAGVLIDAEVFDIEASVPLEQNGVAICYKLTLRLDK